MHMCIVVIWLAWLKSRTFFLPFLVECCYPQKPQCQDNWAVTLDCPSCGKWFSSLFICCGCAIWPRLPGREHVLCNSSNYANCWRWDFCMVKQTPFLPSGAQWPKCPKSTSRSHVQHSHHSSHDQHDSSHDQHDSSHHQHDSSHHQHGSSHDLMVAHMTSMVDHDWHLNLTKRPCFWTLFCCHVSGH